MNDTEFGAHLQRKLELKKSKSVTFIPKLRTGKSMVIGCITKRMTRN